MSLKTNVNENKTIIKRLCNSIFHYNLSDFIEL